MREPGPDAFTDENPIEENSSRDKGVAGWDTTHVRSFPLGLDLLLTMFCTSASQPPSHEVFKFVYFAVKYTQSHPRDSLPAFDDIWTSVDARIPHCITPELAKTEIQTPEGP